MGATDLAHFDALFRNDADPWRTLSSNYERTKRAATIASLGERRFRRAFEPGCANGVLTEQLAARCDLVLAMDSSAVALTRARRRLSHRAHIALSHGVIPRDWPHGTFDLVAISEVGYYLDEEALADMAFRMRASLEPGGLLVACHWRHREPDFACDAVAVHAALDTVMDGACRTKHVERDFILQTWASRTEPR